MIKEIVEFIEDRTSFVVGTDLFMGHREPANPDRCQVVLESAGGAVYGEIPDRVDKNVQVISRGRSYMDARDDAFEIYEALHGTAGWNAPLLTSGYNYFYYVIDALADPQYIGQDERGMYEFSTNYIFRICNPP